MREEVVKARRHLAQLDPLLFAPGEKVRRAFLAACGHSTPRRAGVHLANRAAAHRMSRRSARGGILASDTCQ